MSDAINAVLHMAEDLHDKAYEYALRYVVEPDAEHLSKIRELRDAAELLRWAAEGAPKPEYSLDNVL
jgi:hypothetical protein